MTDWIQALVIGLLGSLHCAGMCGPIALALPMKARDLGSRMLSSLTYNLGRIITYGLLGWVFGLLGRGLYLGGLQQVTSIVAGSIMILSVVFPLVFKQLHFNEGISGGLSLVKSGFRKFLSIRSYASILMMGLLNGVLPCGLVYIALAGAIVTGQALHGGLFMICFGLGTLPMMFLLPLLGSIIGKKFRNASNKIIPWFIILIGILFIIRGLNLGIPYVSPEISKHELKAKCCHK